MTPQNAMIDRLRDIVGSTGLLTGSDVHARQTNTIRPQPLQALALVRPASTDEVSRVMAACHAAGVAVVPQGGLTGLVHGADAGPDEIALSLERMNRITAVDAGQRVLEAEAGVILEQAQTAAAAAGLLFPVDLGARGSATLGGMAATNAGGNRVIRYGMMRDNVLGLEVVLADGTVISSLNHLIKNNAGYDLKQLFIGSEGTLGIVTRLILRLREAPSDRCVALLALPDFAAVGQVLRRIDRGLDGRLSAFEVMWPDFYRLVTTAPAMTRPPLSQAHAYYVLVEASGGSPAQAEHFSELLGSLMEDGLIDDATLAQSERESEALWALRDDVAQMGRWGAPVGYDISLRLADTGPYVDAVAADVRSRWPAARLWAFGHLGDNNLHLVVQIADLDEAGRAALDRLVYSPLGRLNGTISAEHGIGTEKKPWLAVSRSDAELALMRRFKRTLDPASILSPGRIFDLAPMPGQWVEGRALGATSPAP